MNEWKLDIARQDRQKPGIQEIQELYNQDAKDRKNGRDYGFTDFTGAEYGIAAFVMFVYVKWSKQSSCKFFIGVKQAMFFF